MSRADLAGRTRLIRASTTRCDAWAILLYFMQSYSSVNPRLDVLFLSSACQFVVTYLSFVRLFVVTAGSETRFKLLLPPFWPNGVVHSLLLLILDISLL